MRTKTQDPKYDIEDGRLINAATGEPIPDDEPVFIMRAKDRRAAVTLSNYRARCKDDQHVAAVGKRVFEFDDYAKRHPELMKEPDTTPAKA